MTPCVPDAGSPRKPLEYETMPAVRVIMSTFNGAKFLPELLTSVSQQTGVTVRWWIRDGGSTDSTREILTDASSHMDMHVSAGSNKGVVSSFLELLQTCPKDGDFYAFCDQHDAWLGMAGLSALLGGCLTLLWRSARRGAKLPMMMYAWCVPALLLSIQAEHFWTGLNELIKLLALLGLVFAPWKLKARRGASVCQMT